MSLKNCILIPLVLIVCAFVGCRRNVLVEERLTQAAPLVATQADSALHLLEGINPDHIFRASTRARYALLYTQTLDKNYIDIDNDSLIRIADKYYNRHHSPDSVKFLANYYYGRVLQNAADFTTAIEYFLKAQKIAENTNNPYYMGLVYTRLGELYYSQMNFDSMLEYNLKAYDQFLKMRNQQYIANSLFSIGNAYLALTEYTLAENYYNQALELSRKRQDLERQADCLSNIAFVRVRKGSFTEARKIINEVKSLSDGNLSSSEYQLLVKTFLAEKNIDSARYYLHLFASEATDLRDTLTNAYLNYQLGLISKDIPTIQHAVDEYIILGDSLTRLTLRQSATIAERRFYQEQSVLAAYRLKVRSLFECVCSCLIVLIIGCVIYYYRLRVRRNREQLDLYISIIDEFRSSKERIISQLETQKNVQSHLKTLVLSRFDMLDQLGRTFYERDNTKAQQEAIYKEVKMILSELSSNVDAKRNLEEVVNVVNDNIMQKLREQVPQIKDDDLDLLCYIYAGFSVQVISVLLGVSLSAIYTRKSRLKSRFANSDAPDKLLFVANM